MAITVTHSKVSTIPDGDDSSLIRPSDWNDDHVLVGLGTMAEQNANAVAITGGTMSGVTVTGYIPTTEKAQPLGVATLDASGKVPTSQIPLQGDLNYQGTWNATTNSPTLTSGVGTKGYYYVVDVAGNTNLDGITDWKVGDWAIFNGTVWQKVDNTDAVTSVNGYTGTVVLTYTDVGAFPATATTGTGNVVLQTNPTVYNPNIDVIDFDTTYATTLTAGQLGWDGNNTLGIGMAGGSVIQRIGEDTYIYVKASASITKGQLVMFTGVVGASSVVTAAPSTGVTNGQYIIGLAAESISNNNFGLIQVTGSLKGFDTSAFTDGDILYYDSAVTGGLTKTYPTSGLIVTVCAVTNAGSGGSGSVQIRVSVTQRIAAGTAISVSQSGSGTTVTNTAPDQTVVLTAGTGISTSGTYPNFTITNTLPSLGGTVTSVSGTGTVSGISLSGTVTSSGSLTLGGTLDLSSPPAIGGTTPAAITGTTITASQYVGISGGTF